MHGSPPNPGLGGLPSPACLCPSVPVCLSLSLSVSVYLCLCTPALASWVQALPDHLQTKGLLLLPKASPNRESLHNKQRTRETLHTARAPWEQAALAGLCLCVIRICVPGELDKNLLELTGRSAKQLLPHASKPH